MAQGNSAVSFRQRAIIDPANDYKIEDLKQEFFLPAPNALGDGTSVQLAASYTLQLGVLSAHKVSKASSTFM